MATKILFLYNNLLDSATLTASSEATGFPANNVKNSFRTKIWRTAGATAGTANLVIDHGTAKAVTCIALTGYSWASAPSTFNFEANATDSWGTPSFSQALTWYASPSANGNKAVIIKTFASQSYRYNRLNVVYSPGDWDLGRIFVGSYFAPARNYTPIWMQDFIDPSIAMQTIGGQEHIDQIEKYRTLGFSCLISTQAQWELYQAMINNVGISKDLFVAFDYDSEPDEMTIYGRFTELPGARNVPVSYKQADFIFQESR